MAVVAIALLVAASCPTCGTGFPIVDGARHAVVVVPAKPTEQESLAAAEIAEYVQRMSGVKLDVKRSAKPEEGSIVIATRKSPELGDEGYSISVRDGRLCLTGSRGRSVLYAAYDLLERLGCRWLSPKFSYYGADAEAVPRTTRLVLRLDGPVVEKPRLKFRKLYVEEGHSHTQENLAQMAEWMAKSRFNTLVVPTDYQGSGRVKWDNWRVGLTPELRKRDIIIEVGGHGYQNFLNAQMAPFDGAQGGGGSAQGDKASAQGGGGSAQDGGGSAGAQGTLFDQHPEWFGMDAEGNRQREHRYVPCTSNPAAVEYLTRNVVAYLKSHPEIEIFDFWPPDGCKWCECGECKALGTPQDRQSRLIAHVVKSADEHGIKARFECIAYSSYTTPPSNPAMDPSVLVDFCPINQCFEKQIDDASSDRNLAYASALREWKKSFAGDVSIYSYYRKYAWHSLPNLIPHYMQADLRWYAGIGIAGVSTYAEPGDWRTYELNHYTLARLAWDPDASADAIISDFCASRYGSAAGAAKRVYQALEETVRMASGIPFTSLKDPAEIERHASRLRSARDAFEKAAGDTPSANALVASVDYALRDFALQKQISSGGSVEERRAMVEELAGFLKSHEGEGVFLSGRRTSAESLAKGYRL